MATIELVKPRKNTSEKSWKEFKDCIVGQSAVIESFKPFFDLITYESIYPQASGTLGNFLLAGPTGVGKGEFARALATAIHGNSEKLLTISCNEMAQDHEVSKLLGAPASFVGHGDTKPILSNKALALVKSPISNVSIILWDEVEKGSPRIYDIIMNGLDRGFIQNNSMETVSFSNVINIFTTNLGQKHSKKNLISHESISRDQDTNAQMAEIKRFFRTEFINRLDKIFLFDSFSNEELVTLLDMEIARYFRPSCMSGAQGGLLIKQIAISKPLMDDIIQQAEPDLYGARQLKRKVRQSLGQVGLALVNNSYGNKIGSFSLTFAFDTSGKVIAELVEITE